MARKETTGKDVYVPGCGKHINRYVIFERLNGNNTFHTEPVNITCTVDAKQRLVVLRPSLNTSWIKAYGCDGCIHHKKTH